MPLGFYGPPLGGPGQGTGSTKQQLQALGLLPPDQPTNSPSFLGSLQTTAAQANEAPRGPVVEGQAMPAVRQGLSNLWDTAQAQGAQAMEAPKPDAADTSLALKAAQAADSPPTPTGLYPPQQPPQAPQGLYTAPQSAPATTPAQAPQAPPVAPPGAPTAAPGPATGAPVQQPPAPYQEASLRPMAPPTPGPNAGGDRYGSIWQSVIPGESGGNPNAKNKLSSASGVSQITDDTFKDQFLGTPSGQGYSMADKNDPKVQALAGRSILASNDATFQSVVGRPATDGELQASWLLGGKGAASLAAHPNEPIYNYLTPGAIANNPMLRGGMTGSQALQAVNAYYAGKGGGGVPSSSPSGNLAAAQTAMQSPGAQAGDVGINPDEIMRIATKLGYKPTEGVTGPGDKFISMGLGMLGGRTMADSFKNAGEAFKDSRGQDISMREHQNANALGMAQVGINDARLGQTARMQEANYKLSQSKLDQQIAFQNNLMTNRDAATVNHTNQTNATISGTTAENHQFGQDAAKSIDALNKSAPQDAENLQNVVSARNLISQNHGLMGPTPTAALNRVLAGWGFGDTASLSALDKMTAQARMSYLQDVTNGHVGGIRSNTELVNIGRAVATAQTDAGAADYILAIQQQQVEARSALRQAVHEHVNDPAWQGRGFSDQSGQFMTNYFKDHQVPVWDAGKGTQSPVDLSKFWTK